MKIKKIIRVIIIIIAAFAAGILLMNILTWLAGDKITAADEVTAGADCILVLGAGVYADGTPTPMLADRLDCALSLYEEGKAPKILVSGDHGQDHYDETNAMKDYLTARGVPSADVFMDHAGFNTYDSIYRARDIFGVERAVIVTQKYHLYRALYIADRLGISAQGVAADTRYYHGQPYREVREMAARCKDVIQCVFKPQAALMGETIPISGDGDITNDRTKNDDGNS